MSARAPSARTRGVSVFRACSTIRVRSPTAPWKRMVAVLVSVIPGMYAARQHLHQRTHNVSRGTPGTRARTRTLLVAAEVAVALMLLSSAGLLLRTISRVFAAPAGFDSTRLLTMQVQISGKRYASANERLRFYSEAVLAVRSVPGVSAAALTALLPLGGELDMS